MFLDVKTDVNIVFDAQLLSESRKKVKQIEII